MTYTGKPKGGKRDIPTISERVARWRGEHDLQIAVTDYLNWAMPSDIVWTAIDHAAKLSNRQATDRRRRGVKRGIPDYIFILQGGQAAFIELKSKTGTLTAEQKIWRDRAVAQGALFAVCRSLEQVVAILAGWGVQLKFKPGK